MKAIFAKYWNDILSSYWFIPALMATGAIAMAIFLTSLDKYLGSGWAEQSSWLLSNRPQGARALLAAIAGSMITVAGVTFSVTISAVAYATSQFGPRLLTNFMQDRGNQVTLGTFIAAFIYCLLVLRTVRSADEVDTSAQASADLIQAFVPQLAMLGAIALALASVAVLIYFIHHVPATIHISTVAARIGNELTAQIEYLCQNSEAAGNPAKTQLSAPDKTRLQEKYQTASAVRTDKEGYLQHLDGDGLLSFASEHDLLLFVARTPGDFVIARRPLVYAWPATALNQAGSDEIRRCFAFGDQRTQAQDLMFLTQELVEIAVRALSPGVNDPFTAINCMNWLASALSALAVRTPPSAYRYDDDGQLRVIYPPFTFTTMLNSVCNDLRPHVKRDRSAALHLLETLASIAPDVLDSNARETLIRHAALLSSGCEQALEQREDRVVIADRCAEIMTEIRDPNTRTDHYFSNEMLQDTGR